MKVLKNEKGVDVECEIVGAELHSLAASSFSVNTNPRLGSILRFMLTLNKAAFDICIAGRCGGRLGNRILYCAYRVVVFVGAFAGEVGLVTPKRAWGLSVGEEWCEIDSWSTC